MLKLTFSYRSVGKKISGDWWIKAQISDGNIYDNQKTIFLATKTEGRDVLNKLIIDDENGLANDEN